MVVEPKDVPSDREEKADAVVVGTGAGGSVVAALLAESGMRVVVLEAGGYYNGKDFTQREKDMIDLLYEERGARATVDQAVTVLQARCVGGTPVINNCICFRTPPEVLAEWRTQHGLDMLTDAELEPHFAAVERDQKVQKITESQINKNNSMLVRGAKVKGIKTDTFMHNRDGCVESGFCLLGCTYEKKMNSLTVYVPRALKAGATLFPHARAHRILVEGGRAVGVEAEITDPRPRAGQATPRRLTVRAPKVFLCAGPINTPQILLNNRLANSSGQVGQNLSLHPLIAALGFFEEEIKAYVGIPQCAYSHDFREEKGPGQGGYIIEGIFVHPGLFSSAIPAYSTAGQDFMANYNHYSAFYAQIHDSGRGHVAVSRRGRALIHYEITELDWRKARHAHKTMAGIFLAAGAKWVTTTHIDRVDMRTEADFAKLDAMPYRANSLTVFSAHPQGTCHMGVDAKKSVVGHNGETHDVKGLYVADASLFPTPTGVNPMISVNTLAHRIATLAVQG